MSKRVWIVAVLAVLVGVAWFGAAVQPVAAASGDSSGKEAPAQATPVTIDGPVPLFPLAAHAECTADCGDGTGWRCTGETVTCVDGEGCIAEGGGKTAIGLCGGAQ